MSFHTQRTALPVGYKLLWYELRSILGQGGFGITYLAHDTNLDQLCAIKEYLPLDFAVREADSTVRPATGEQGGIYRWGLHHFLNEAQTLARFKHPHIVRVLTVFEQNNTAYMAMEHEQGADLAALFKQGQLREESALLNIVLSVLDGLALVHEAGFIHRDIKPSNIYIRDDGSPVLLDFGAARELVEYRTRALTNLVTAGYAPFEQYSNVGEQQGPWTDIYAMGATLYEAIANTLPPDALQRSVAHVNQAEDPYVPASTVGAGRYSPHFLGAVDYALRFLAVDRPQDVRAWAQTLQGFEPVPLLDDETQFQRIRNVTSGGAAEPREKAATQPTKRITAPEYEQHSDTAPTIETTVLQGERRRKPVTSNNGRGWVLPVLGVFALAAVVLVATQVIPLSTVLEHVQWVGETADLEQRAPTANGRRHVAELLAQAQVDVEEGRLIDPPGQNALERYREVLAVDASHTTARRGIARLHDHYVQRAENALALDRHDAAESNINIAEDIERGTKDVRLAREKLAELRKRADRTEVQAHVRRLLAQAEADVRANRFVAPRGQNALERYREVLEIVPENREAKRGTLQLQDHYLRLAAKAIVTNQPEEARNNLRLAEGIHPETERLHEIWEKLAEAERRGAMRKTRVSELLAQAETQFNAGNWQNALQRYREILAEDPDNQAAKGGIAQLLDHYVRLAEKAIVEHQLETAAENLNIADDIQAGAPSVSRAWTRLAERSKQGRKRDP